MQARVQVGRSLQESVGLLRRRPLAMLALGAATVLSLLSVCCAIGVVMAPWLLCELMAMQLGEALHRPIAREQAWFSAGLILFGAVLFSASVGWLTWLGLGTEADVLAAPAPTFIARLANGAGVLAAVSALCSLFLVLPFMYAPLILLEARASVGGAVLESARLVVLGGGLRHYGLSLANNTLQMLPVLSAGFLAALWAPEHSWPLLTLLSVPLLSISVPLGHGMIVSAYVRVYDQVVDRQRTRLVSRPPRALVLVWIAIGAAPLLGFTLLGASLVQPSRLASGSLPSLPAEVLADHAPIRKELRVYPPGTALEIVFSEERASVIASDGGGAGALPLRHRAPIDAVRVIRIRDRYGIELSQAGQPSHTFVDAAGVRLDDDLSARLLDRVPSWALLMMLASLFATACVLLPVLAALAELRRVYALPLEERPRARELSAARKKTLRRAYAAAALLSPAAIFTLYWGARCVF